MTNQTTSEVCACCGREYELVDWWCDDCALHVLAGDAVFWQRTWRAQHSEDCPFRETPAEPIKVSAVFDPISDDDELRILDAIDALGATEVEVAGWSTDDKPMYPPDGVALIADERQRQISEHDWTPEHDDEYQHGELVLAAWCYLTENPIFATECGDGPPESWPWHKDWWKPSDDPTRNLYRAGALIAAEIDRLQRAGGQEGESDGA